MSEKLLTVEQTAERLQLSPLTVQRQLKRGALRGIKRGRVWRVPESALMEDSPRKNVSQNSAPESRAAAILNDLQSSDMAKRNAAILQLARADENTRALVEAASQRAVDDYAGDEDDFADWHNLDGEAFHFPEERFPEERSES